MELLYGIAEKYAEGQRKTIKDKNILAFQYLRHLKYNSITWNLAAGVIDDNFISNINNNENVSFTPSDMNIYLSDLGVSMSIAHLAATANAQLFNSTLTYFLLLLGFQKY